MRTNWIRDIMDKAELGGTFTVKTMEEKVSAQSNMFNKYNTRISCKKVPEGYTCTFIELPE